ncbi:MAG: 2-ketoglutarate ferredoxin oxidoreductase subunit delta [Candidatus Zixiibacteriota bacterium]|nr:MAG: 2-ketoglutarate ferredoxin oxidoreductase subunit delta [candidate division Zixibacteria bacterium]
MAWCKACNICIALCPKQVFEPDRDGKPIQARAEDCNQCTICWVHCPDLAITSNYK